MNVITLRDYAKNNNISYEAVRQQIIRYKKELGDHIIKDGRQQFLDEEAVAFLDSKRQKNPVAIIQQDKNEQIEALEKENKLLLQQIAVVQEELIKAKDRNRVLELENAQIALLEGDKENLEAKVNETKEKLQEASEKLSEAEEYAKSLEEWTKLSWLKRIRTPKPVREHKE